MAAELMWTTKKVGSIPTLQAGRDRLAQIPGSMPRLTDIPAGCAFNPRCDRVMDRCRASKPALARVGTNDMACFLYDDAGASTSISASTRGAAR